MFIRHRDDEGVDFVEVRIQPRYKTSELSGDEWRVSAVVRFGYKGHVVYERSFGKVEWAVAALPYLLMTWHEGRGRASTEPKGHPCDQFGCWETATVFYRMKATYDALGHKEAIPEGHEYQRGFCSRHSTRGDCGLDDADDNYELIGSADSLQAPRPEDVRPALFGGVIDLTKDTEG